MTQQSPNKKPFLFVDDYGTGGIWVYVTAETPSDVIKKYPGLKHVTSKPSWLAEHEKQHSLPVYDLEANPEKLAYLTKEGA